MPRKNKETTKIPKTKQAVEKVINKVVGKPTPIQVHEPEVLVSISHDKKSVTVTTTKKEYKYEMKM